MAEDTTNELSNDDLLRTLLARVDQLFAQQQLLYTQQQELSAQQQETNARLDAMDARLIKVEAFVDDRSRDTRPKLDSIYKDVADIKEDLRATNHTLRLFREDIWGERKERAGMEYRIELLERKAA